ncbi:MAG: DNA-deoxyinosine glycosylase [Gammaproteobacteria bacterium]|nr:DNA-deoxyinosine glycosylase [Gammaproteobacteria bacterium]MCY4219111.1 DNA-deoxyinosine glycosylase [Gammaproteobacteria bacterium]
MMIKVGLGPIIDVSSRILILGSLPGDISLSTQEYYANPRNHFWKILFCIYNQCIEKDYELKRAFLQRHEIALWDVLKSAERKGSLDSNIRSPNVNNLEELIQEYPKIRAVGLNGRKAWHIFNRHWGRHPLFNMNGIKIGYLPSSSPVPGKNVKSFDQKVKVWQNFLARST